jgi:hypothetical protein
MQQMWLPDVQVLLYNDEPPYAVDYNFTVAHAKAAFFWDATNAVGVFHSIPKFPVGPAQAYEYIGLLENAWEYAQHIICITMPYTAFLGISQPLAALNPRMYEGTFPEEPQPILPVQECSYIPFGNRILITKPAAYKVDIWSSCVGSYFFTDLQVISWVHGQVEGAYCNGTETLDITEISYSFGEAYSNYENHAKWGIGQSPLVCFGDLNRVVSQMERSGAVACWKDIDTYAMLQGIIANTNECMLSSEK